VTRRPSVPFVVLVVLLGTGILFALSWSPAVTTPGPPAGRTREPSASGPPEAPPPSGRLRDVFAYEDPEPTTVVPPPTLEAELSVPPPLAPSPPNPVVLVGFVRQRGELRTALSIRGEVTVLAKDESAGGYTVLAIDEDRGVTLRDPDGGALTLAPPP
jgi:hypothetical protein